MPLPRRWRPWWRRLLIVPVVRGRSPERDPLEQLIAREDLARLASVVAGLPPAMRETADEYPYPVFELSLRKGVNPGELERRRARLVDLCRVLMGC